jgi:hypothetical protein
MTEIKTIRRITGKYWYGNEAPRYHRVYTLNLTGDAEELLRAGVRQYFSQSAGNNWNFRVTEDCTYKRKVNPKNFAKLERNKDYQRGQEL